MFDPDDGVAEDRAQLLLPASKPARPRRVMVNDLDPVACAVTVGCDFEAGPYLRHHRTRELDSLHPRQFMRGQAAWSGHQLVQVDDGGSRTFSFTQPAPGLNRIRSGLGAGR